MAPFDTCIITASNERQASVFRTLLQRRLDAGLYPRDLVLRVCADPPAGRVGSGGGTLWALLDLLRHEGVEVSVGGPDAIADRAAAHLERRRILMIHAGGQSRRLPAYVPEGKIFAPVPVRSRSRLAPVVLDLELSLFFRYPWRNGELIVTSGDALVDFDTDRVRLPDAPLCGFAAPDSFDVGSRHGVFVFEPATAKVSDYLQKAPVEVLSRSARIQGTERCGVDLGPVSIRAGALHGWLSLAFAMRSGAGIAELLGRGELSLDLYLEVLSAGLGDIDLPTYRQRMHGRSAAPREVLDLVYESFHPCGLSAVLVEKPAFIHFGSVSEFPQACREVWERGLAPFYGSSPGGLAPEVESSTVRFNSIDTTLEPRGDGVCLEGCQRVRATCEGENLLVGLEDLDLPEPLARGFCLEERKLDDEGAPAVVRLVYHQDDTFKPQASAGRIVFCGQPLLSWLSSRGLSLPDVTSAPDCTDLYALDLFAVDADPFRLAGYWRLPDDPDAWASWFRLSRRLCLSEVNARTDAAVRDEGRSEVRRALFSR